MARDKRVIIVGAGPGGLTSAMILAKMGFEVRVYEKKPYVGGRNSTLTLGDYVFDTGPTFLMMKQVLEDAFAEAGKKLGDYCNLVELDPMYKLSYDDKIVFPSRKKRKMVRQINQHFPGYEAGLDHFYQREELRFRKMYPCLQKPYSSLGAFFSTAFIKALPHLALTKTLWQVLGNYFPPDQLRTSFTFQAKYLGMSPWECPGAFAIIPYIEHAFGIFHVIGGLSRISEAMAEVVRENGGRITLSSPVERILIKNGTARGVRLTTDEEIEADAVVIGADFGHAMTRLFQPGVLKKYTPSHVHNMKYSCSTFMLYLGVDTVYDEPHHNIIFADDYKRNIEDIAKLRGLPDDMSIYVRNATATDPTLAPAGHSAVYVLVPVVNNKGPVIWTDDLVAEYREKVLNRIVKRTSMKDLRSRIVEEKIITPRMWQREYDIYEGATFNLAHNLRQMLYFRPRNRFEEVRRCYLVGGGTHPGSGLPTIYESARISSRLVHHDLGMR